MSSCNSEESARPLLYGINRVSEGNEKRIIGEIEPMIHWRGNTKRIVLFLSISLLAVVILASAQLAEAQQGGKVYRIGRLSVGSPRAPRRIKLKRSRQRSSLQIVFRQRLRELGYVVGQNLVIERRNAKSKHERLPDLAAELVRLKVDVIVTSPAPPATRAAQWATRKIPIVMGGIGVDPVEEGFVVSLARPGGNITGLTNLTERLHPKRLELLKEAFPRISRVAIIWHWHKNQQKHGLKETEAVGQALGIQIQSLDVGSSDELESAFSAISRERPDGLLVVTSGHTLGHRARIIEFTAKRQLPTIYGRSRFVKAGGLMSYGVDRQHLIRRVATYVDKIFKGAKPADLPVEQPTKFDLVINLKTA